MALVLGLSVYTFNYIKRLHNSPFELGVHYRFVGAGTRITQWDQEATELAYTEWQRPPAKTLENYRCKVQRRLS